MDHEVKGIPSITLSMRSWWWRRKESQRRRSVSSISERRMKETLPSAEVTDTPNSSLSYSFTSLLYNGSFVAPSPL